MADKFKYKTVHGREYRIGKFSAQHGPFILTKVSSVVGPAIAELVKSLDFDLDKVKNPEDLLKEGDLVKSVIDKVDMTKLFAPLSAMSQPDFMYVQQKCLNVCQVKLPSGYVPAMHANGSFSISELEDDSMAVMALMVHALVHNFAGFFSESLSTASGGITQDTNLPS